MKYTIQKEFSNLPKPLKYVMKNLCHKECEKEREMECVCRYTERHVDVRCMGFVYKIRAKLDKLK